MRKYTFIFSCTDNGGGYQTFEVRATDKQVLYISARYLMREEAQ